MKEKAIQLLNDFATCYNAEMELLPIKELSDLDNVIYIIFDAPLAADEVFSELGHAYSFSDYGTIFVRVSTYTWGSLEYDISSLKKRLEKLQDTRITLLAKHAVDFKKQSCEELLFTCAYCFDNHLNIIDDSSKCKYICFKSKAYKDKFFKENNKFIIIDEDSSTDLIYKIINVGYSIQQLRSIFCIGLNLDEQRQNYYKILKKIVNYKNEKEN